MISFCSFFLRFVFFGITYREKRISPRSGLNPTARPLAQGTGQSRPTPLHIPPALLAGLRVPKAVRRPVFLFRKTILRLDSEKTTHGRLPLRARPRKTPSPPTAPATVRRAPDSNLGTAATAEAAAEQPPERSPHVGCCAAVVVKSRRRRAYPQQIVTTRLLYCLQDPFAQLSRLQRIRSHACLNYNTRTTAGRFEPDGTAAC